MIDDIFWAQDPLPVPSEPLEKVRRTRARDRRVTEDEPPATPVLSRYRTSLLGRSAHWRSPKQSE